MKDFLSKKEKYPAIFIISLFLLEFFQIQWKPDKFSSILSDTLPVLVSFLVLAITISLFRMEKFRIEGKPDKVEDVRLNLERFGRRIIWVIFVFLIILFLSESNKAALLNYEFKLHIYTIVMSSLIVSVSYIIECAVSYIKNTK